MLVDISLLTFLIWGVINMRLNINRLLLSMSMTSWIIFDWDILNSVSLNPFAFITALLPVALLINKPTDYHGRISYATEDKSANKVASFVCMFCMASVCQYSQVLPWIAWMMFTAVVYLTDFWIYNPNFAWFQFDVYRVNIHGTDRVFITSYKPVMENDLDMRYSYRIADNFYFLH